MSSILQRLTGLLGIVVLLGIALALSRDRRRIPWRIVLWGLGLQLVFAVLILKTTPGRVVFGWASAVFGGLIDFTKVGSGFLFGDLAGKYAAFQILPVLIFFASLMGVLYHLGVMQKLVGGMAWVMRHTMGVSGSEALSAAGNVFVGMTEAPLLIRPYVAGLTDSELLTVMTGGLATIAGSVLAAYVSFGVDAGHLLCASVMSAPAALVVAKIMIPETEESQTGGAVKVGELIAGSLSSTVSPPVCVQRKANGRSSSGSLLLPPSNRTTVPTFTDWSAPASATGGWFSTVTGSSRIVLYQQ